jgi:hypothetical protein
VAPLRWPRNTGAADYGPVADLTPAGREPDEELLEALDGRRVDLVEERPGNHMRWFAGW